jgi:WD40 repeat protein
MNIMQVVGQKGGSRLVSLGADKMIIVFDIRTRCLEGKVSIAQSGMPSGHMQMAVCGDQAIVGGTSGDIYTYDLLLSKMVRSIKGHLNPVFCVAANKNGIVASGDKSGLLKIWNL